MATTSEDLAERSLLAAARDGDDDAIAVLFERHLDDARAVAVHVTRSPADADDVLAAAAEAVLAAIRRGNGPTEAFGPYLTTAVRRHAWRRTAEARHTTPGDVPDTPVDDASFDPIEADTVRRALAQLPPAQRDLLWLAEVEGCSPAELAADHGASPNTMAAAALRARRGLRRAYILAHLGPDAPDACRVALGRLAGSSRRNTSAADVARADAHADACAPCAEVLADLADLRRRRGLLVLLPAAWQLRLLHRAAPQTADGSAPGPGHPASTAAPETTPVPGTVPGHRAAALVGAGAVAMVVLVAAVVTQLDRPEAASAGPTTSVAGTDRRAGTEDATASEASTATDAEAADDADAAGETAPTMATGGSSTDASPTSDAGDDAGTTGTRTAAAPTTAVPTATGPTPQAPTPTTPAAPPTTTPPTTPPTTAPKPFAAVDLGIVGQATAAPPGMLSEFHVQLTNHGTGTWTPTDGPVTVTMAFVQGLTVEQVAADAGWSCGTPKGLTLTCTIEPVAAGTTTIATLAVRVSAARAAGERLPVVVAVAAPSPDADGANDKTVVNVDVA